MHWTSPMFESNHCDLIMNSDLIMNCVFRVKHLIVGILNLQLDYPIG